MTKNTFIVFFLLYNLNILNFQAKTLEQYKVHHFFHIQI